MSHALLVYYEGDIAITVEASPRSAALVIEDAQRHGAESFYLRVNGVPVNFMADIPWEVVACPPAPAD